jgi:hypothetical protein
MEGTVAQDIKIAYREEVSEAVKWGEIKDFGPEDVLDILLKVLDKHFILIRKNK